MKEFKKRHLFWIIPSSLLILLLLISIFGHLLSPVKAKRIPSKSKALKELTLKQQQEDLDYLKYYLTQHYINYDTMIENGFDIDDVINQIEASLKKDRRNNGTIESGSFRSTISRIIINNLNVIDKHFAICGVALKDNIFYFSNIYIKPLSTPNGIKYFVVKNEEETFPDYIKKHYSTIGHADIKAGQEYTGPKENLYEWFDGDEKIYRFGVMAKGSINHVFIQIDGKPVKAPVISTWALQNQKAQGMKETTDTLYLSLRNFMFENSSSQDLAAKNKKEFEVLCNNAREKSKEKKNLILDLRSNGGGELLRSAMLISGLFYNEEKLSSDLYKFLLNQVDEDYTLLSPSIGGLYRKRILPTIKANIRNKKNKNEKTEMEIATENVYDQFHTLNYYCAFSELLVPYRKIEKFPYKKTSVTELPAADFEGTIYVLTDPNSASCSEYTLALLHYMSKNTNIKICQIGQNTNGAVFYFNPHSVLLPNSGGWLYLPTAINKSSNFTAAGFKGEGYGWFPDYWCTNQNIVNTLVNLSGDKELEKVLQGLEKSQL